ncbi:probable LRR receptor-like serine/threonine-protein kinase At3g47570 [Salvia splendens]|uniref:probable LRR receptor-like serine/threonine-protein kinase At3g47570 n=1 Tax=Salvia splendens TaxID=180675 RepID=UPI001C2632D1|nr:probable LRR receptor-like serine/threonine-protein kinase At3g47570 [Salvia splendens]
MANLMTFLLSLPLFFFFLLFTTLLPPATCSTNQTDQLSLLAIKSSLQDPQGALSSWNQTLPLCSWRGIQCRRNRVVTLTLSSLGIFGNLSPHIGNLSLLTNITLNNNSLQGQIPPQITLLTKLRFLDFSNNSFMGELPKNLSQCPNLVQLAFSRNFISGTIPNELGFLPKLQHISFSRNRFSGFIPSSIGNITTLQRLSLGSCRLAGEIPESLGRLHRLEFLQLSENSFTGSIPHALFNISRIEYFDVSHNSLEGVIPSTIGVTLPSLGALLLEQNHFSGPIPNSISNASLIEWLILSFNYFTGPIPNLESLTLLQNFLLISNLIEDDMSFISSLTNSTNLEWFDVSKNMLSGSLPESLANLSIHINMFYIQKNHIHGNIPVDIGNLGNLQMVDMSHNLLDGPIPMSMSKLSNLQSLRMRRNRFRGELPSMFGNMTVLSRFQLDGNELSGNVPSSLGNCTKLLELDLSENKFTGLIPREIMRLSSLSIVLNLSHNALEGSIPSEIGSFRNLVALDLSSNRLSGVIPTSLSSCISLQWLYLDKNLLHGEIPEGMSTLMGLRELDLARNNLSGLIPSFLGSLKLQKLNLSFNRLQGEIPTRGVFTNRSSIFLDGNLGLCGGIEELVFPPCKGVESSKEKLSTLWKILIPILVVGGLCIVILVFFKYKKLQENACPFVDTIVVQPFMRFSYADLVKATNGFSESNVLGFGRFGSVYKAILDDDNDTTVAVKVLNLDVKGASKTFMAECRALGGIRHRNLVKLVSVCDTVDFKGNDFKALVYEFKVNGSLDKWLHNNEEESGEDFKSLSIIQRLNIALDIAQGIEYLHFGSGSSIIHGDLKPSNIILDHDMIACVGDFGLAKVVSNILPSSCESNTSSIGIKGTVGYIPPEYGLLCSVSMLGDIYSFGIIILEMFTNKRPTDNLFGGEANLHRYVSSNLPHRLVEIIDPKLGKGALKMEFIVRVLNIGVSCSKENPRDRMPINLVVNELAGILAQCMN